jgi:hypothetical protein
VVGLAHQNAYGHGAQTLKVLQGEF